MRVRDRVSVVAALAVFGVISVACKYSYTPPGSSIDATADAVAELATAPMGSCKPESGNNACVAGGKAAYCKTRYVHDGPKHLRADGDWVTFTCPDCNKSSQYAHIKCSDYTAGEPCDTFVADEMCRPDKRGMYRCDHDTSTWTIEPCPGGCDQTYQVVCRH
jgi:hypothetical protein